jgi:phytanoyl-CoA hydroxylase
MRPDRICVARPSSDEPHHYAHGVGDITMKDITLTPDQIASYHDLGYLVLESVLDAATLDAIRTQTDEVVAKASEVTSNDEIYDLEASHCAEHPRVRRIKTPHKIVPAIDTLVRSTAVGQIVAQLFDNGVRLQTTKLNMKSAEFGAPVEWHQDWTFYPHTNDDLLAMGVMLDDFTPDNGPLMIVPRSHRGTVYDHHAGGYFCGAVDPAKCDLQFEDAAPLIAPAGSLTFHHVRAMHGSRLNHSNSSRRLLLAQYTAIDAWPLLKIPADIKEYDRDIVIGEPTIHPRMADVPVRLPLPPAPHDGSIYENQRTLGNRYFEDHVGEDHVGEDHMGKDHVGTADAAE